MNARIAIATLLLAVPAGMASAQSAVQGRAAIDGSVVGVCVLGPPSQTAVPLGTLVNTSGPRTGKLAVIPVQAINLPGSYCNFAGTTISIAATAMVAADAAAPQAGFARAVNFTSTVSNWAAATAAVTTAASVGGATPAANGSGGTQPAPKIADLTLTLTNFAVPSDLLLVSGGYAGAVTITLGPAATP